MAYAILPKPGTKFGPCKKQCHHRDCEETRYQASIICYYCAQPIGYGTKFVNDPEKSLVHWLCEMDAIDKARTEKSQ